MTTTQRLALATIDYARDLVDTILVIQDLVYDELPMHLIAQYLAIQTVGSIMRAKWGIPSVDHKPRWLMRDFQWAITKLRKGHKVRRPGMAGGRRFYKSVEQAQKLCSEADCMAEDWEIYRKPEEP